MKLIYKSMGMKMSPLDPHRNIDTPRGPLKIHNIMSWYTCFQCIRLSPTLKGLTTIKYKEVGFAIS